MCSSQLIKLTDKCHIKLELFAVFPKTNYFFSFSDVKHMTDKFVNSINHVSNVKSGSRIMMVTVLEFPLLLPND